MKLIRYVAATTMIAILTGCTIRESTKPSASSDEITAPLSVTTVETTAEETTIGITETVPPETTVETTTAPPTETTTTITTTVPPTTTIATTPPPTTETTTAVTTTTAPPAVPEPTTGMTSKGYSITVSGGVTYVDGVLIANKTYALPSTYYPGGLTAETYAAFQEMKVAAAAAGHNIFVKSGFRSYADQRYIYNGYVARDGQALADTYSARAGHSEHQSGMAIDVNSLYTSFANTPEGIWLKDNCHLFGFIIRYPEGKESVTGYMYEPWHIRYVGRELAPKIKESGLCLEEYFGITSQYGY